MDSCSTALAPHTFDIIYCCSHRKSQFRLMLISGAKAALAADRQVVFPSVETKIKKTVFFQHIRISVVWKRKVVGCPRSLG